MSLSQMQVFNDQVQLVATEIVDQSVRKFNEASGGALVLGNATHIGDYLEEASYKLIGSLVARRNAYGNSSPADLTIQQMLDRAVKVDQRIGPVLYSAEQFRRLNKNPEEAGLIVGQQAAEAMIQDYLNTALTAAVGAIENEDNSTGSLVYDGTASTATLGNLNKAKALFGDRSQSLIAWVLTGKAFHDVIGERITNSAQLFTIGNIRIMEDGLGSRFVVTDSPALTTADTAANQRIVGLVPGAVSIQTAPMLSEMIPVLGGENVSYRWQGESSFTVGLKGYAWDAANGGKSPNDAALATGSNWDKIVTSLKDTAGVILAAQ
jgi:hypothetical protein